MVDAFSELGYISITPKGYRAVEFAFLTENADIDQGDKPCESIPTMGGGRIVKFNPQEDSTITLEAYPTTVIDYDLRNKESGVQALFNGRSITQIDDCDAITGWTKAEQAGTPSVNTTTKKEGVSSLNFIKDGTNSALAKLYKNITAVNLSTSGMYVYIWMYINSMAKLDVSADGKLEVDLGTGGLTNINRYYIHDKVQAGWNLIRIDPDAPDAEGGSGATESNIDYIQFIVNTATAGTTLSAGDLMIDNIHYIAEGQPISTNASLDREDLEVDILFTNQDNVSGTVSTITNSTIVVADTPYTNDELIGRRVRFTSGTAIGKEYIVTDNTNNTIYIAGGTMTDDGALANDTFNIIPTGRGGVSSSNYGLRYSFKNSRYISLKPSFTDKILKCTVKATLPAFDKNGTSGITIGSTNATAQLEAVPEYA